MLMITMKMLDLIESKLCSNRAWEDGYGYERRSGRSQSIEMDECDASIAAFKEIRKYLEDMID